MARWKHRHKLSATPLSSLFCLRRGSTPTHLDFLEIAIGTITLLQVMDPHLVHDYQLLEHSNMANPGFDGSSSSDELLQPPYVVRPGPIIPEDFEAEMASGTTTSSPPLSHSSYAAWTNGPSPRPRGASIGTPALDKLSSPIVEGMTGGFQLQRPSGPARTPSNTYAPVRRPNPFLITKDERQRSTSSKRNTRRDPRDPNAQYRAQEKAYVQRIREDPQGWFSRFEDHKGFGISAGDSDIEDPSPSSEVPFEDDAYDPDIQLFLNDDNQPTIEELKHPKNQERLEWHSMLASVLKGDVVKQEKQRLLGSTESTRSAAQNYAIWLGVRARMCGRSVPLQRKLIEEARAGLAPIVEDIIKFEIKGETEIGKSPFKQVEDIVEQVEKCEALYSSNKELELAHPRIASEEYTSSRDAVVAWHNTTVLINTELAILQKWVGNDGLDFSKAAVKTDKRDLPDETSFLDRILKEDGLKTLQGEHNMLHGISAVIQKAKSTLIENANSFAKRHLPPYIEELLILINFPSRLIQEIIRVRLSYAKKHERSSRAVPDFGRPDDFTVSDSDESRGQH